jgi:hypothetical protein
VTDLEINKTGSREFLSEAYYGGFRIRKDLPLEDIHQRAITGKLFHSQVLQALTPTYSLKGTPLVGFVKRDLLKPLTHQFD